VLDHPGPDHDHPAADHRIEFLSDRIIPKGFFPQQDTGAIVGGVQGPQDASFPVMDNSVKQLVSVIKADPAVAHVNAYTGQWLIERRLHLYIALKPLNVRKVGAPEIINRLRPKMNRLPVASAFLQAAQDLRIGGRGARALPVHHPVGQRAGSLAMGPDSAGADEEASRFSGCEYRRAERGLQELITYDRPPPRGSALRRRLLTAQSTAHSGSRKSQSFTRS
jgi:multidrug efflux pump